MGRRKNGEGKNVSDYSFDSLTMSSSLIAPPCRLLIACAWMLQDGQTWTFSTPVLAIVSSNSIHVAKYGKGLSAPGTVKELLEQGWRSTYRGSSHDGFLAIAEGTIQHFDSIEDYATSNGKAEIVPAEWPPSEDATRLAPTFTRLISELRGRNGDGTT